MNRLSSRLLALLVSIPCVSWAQESSTQSAAEATIRKGVDAYVEAFNSHNAKRVADMWSPDAVYVNRITGEEVVGRDAIAKQFETLFASQKDAKLNVNVESVRLLSPNVAVEQGTAKFILPQAEPEETEYTAVYVQREGKWLLDRVTEQEPEEIPSHYDQLKILEWMVGKWVDQDDSVRIETECHWAKSQNFLIRSFTIAAGDRFDISGMQVIGWDAASKKIRSWTFDSQGGFAEATWTHRKDRWFIHNKGVLSDGRTAAMVNVMKPVDANTFTWQTIERTAGGELLPNIDEVVVVRE